MIKYLPILVIALAIFLPKEALALNQVQNWNFNDGTIWTWNQATSTDTCGVSTQTTGGNSFEVFAQNNTAVKSSRSQLNVGTGNNNKIERGNVYQTYVATGTASQNFTGRFTVSASGSNWGNANWARLDIYNSLNGTYVGTLGCTSFTANLATTTVISSAPVVLQGGTSYKIRVSTSVKNGSGAGNNSSYVTNVIVTAPPVNVGISLDGTNQPVLTWDTSTATTTANTASTTEPYVIYRGTSSGGQVFRATTTAQTFTDTTATTPGQTYYYNIINIDSVGVYSATSTEVSVTIPGGAVNRFSLYYFD